MTEIQEIPYTSRGNDRHVTIMSSHEDVPDNPPSNPQNSTAKPKTKAKKANRKTKAEFERIRESGRISRSPMLRRSNTMPPPNRERLLQLSQPKEPKTEWYTSVGPHLRWGTQEMIWPIKKETLQADSTKRISALSLPKVNFLKGDNINRSQFYYSCGRESVLWQVGGPAKKAQSTERLDVLSEPKKAHRDFQEDRAQFAYSCGRQSPIWKVDKGAKSCGDRPRTRQLANHKELHREFVPEKPVRTIVTPTAMTAQATERLLHLATPKNRNEGPFRQPTWEVTPSAKNATATNRCMELARPKGVVDGYQLPRDEEWQVTRAAKRAGTTGRIDELSKPIVRATMDHVQFNPDAFLVKPLALKGSFPQRVDELSRPIER